MLGPPLLWDCYRHKKQLKYDTKQQTVARIMIAAGEAAVGLLQIEHDNRVEGRARVIQRGFAQSAREDGRRYIEIRFYGGVKAQLYN